MRRLNRIANFQSTLCRDRRSNHALVKPVLLVVLFESTAFCEFKLTFRFDIQNQLSEIRRLGSNAAEIGFRIFVDPEIPKVNRNDRMHPTIEDASIVELHRLDLLIL